MQLMLCVILVQCSHHSFCPRPSDERCCCVRVPRVSWCLRQPWRSQPGDSKNHPLHRQHQQQRQLPQHGHGRRPPLPDLPVPGQRERGLWDPREKPRAAAAAAPATDQRAPRGDQDSADPQRQHSQLHEGFVFVVVRRHRREAGRIQLTAAKTQTEELPQTPP